MALANIKDLVVGGRIVKAGSSENFPTGDWRSYVPVVDQDKCIDCYTSTATHAGSTVPTTASSSGTTRCPASR